MRDDTTVTDRGQLYGRCTILVHDAQTGLLLSEQRVKNKLVDDGVVFIMERIIGNINSTANLFAVGTDATPAAATQQTLISEVYRAFVATSTPPDPSDYTLEIKSFLFSDVANGHTLKEFGLFADPAPNSTPMLCRLTHGNIVKTTAVAVTYIYQLTLTPE
jgi:hypothetical protein